MATATVSFVRSFGAAVGVAVQTSILLAALAEHAPVLPEALSGASMLRDLIGGHLPLADAALLRLVTVHSLDLLAFDGLSATVDVACSKGTYVRTLASDLGTTLGCGAHLSMLRRTGIGALRVDDAVALEFLEALPADSRDSALSPPDSLLSGLPAARLTESDKGRMLHGQAVRWLGESGQRLRLYGADGDFIGVGEMAQDGWLHPKRLVASAATR